MRGGRAGEVAAAVKVENHSGLRNFDLNPLAANSFSVYFCQAHPATAEPLVEWWRPEDAARAAGNRLCVASPTTSPHKDADTGIKAACLPTGHKQELHPVNSVTFQDSNLTPLFSRAPSMLKMKGCLVARRLQQLVRRGLRNIRTVFRLHDLFNAHTGRSRRISPVRCIPNLAATWIDAMLSAGIVAITRSTPG